MQTILDYDPQQEDYDVPQEVDCPIYYMDPDEEPELDLPEEAVRLEQGIIGEAGEPEENYKENTSVWE